MASAAMFRSLLFVCFGFLLSCAAPAHPRMFLVTIEEIKPIEATHGEDYSTAGLNPSAFENKCLHDEFSAWLYSKGLIKEIRCKLTPAPNTTQRPTPPTTAEQETCLKTPRNARRNLRAAEKLKRYEQTNKNGKKKNTLGFWVKKSNRSVKGFSFCCTRGPRRGSMSRAPKDCKAKTTRK